MNKKRVVFVTGEDLLDVDLPIVKEIHNNYDFIWIVILKGYGWFTESTIKEICIANGIHCRVLLQKHKLKNPKTIFFHFKVLRLLKSLNAALIYDSYLGTPCMHFFTGFFIDRSKIVIAIHDVVQHYKMNNFMIRSCYLNYLIKEYQNIHLFSNNQYSLFRSRYSGTKNILLAPLVLKEFGQQSMVTNYSESHTTFLFFGILRENKGIDLLIKAANILSSKCTNFTIIISGKPDGDCWEKNKELIQNQNVFKLNIRTIPDYEIPDLIASADFLVLPYRDITQSGVLLTSYYYNLPVIASELPGFNEYIVDGQTGLLFKPGCVNSLAAKMESAIYMNKKDYSSMKFKLKSFVEAEISLPSISKKYIDYFDKKLN